MNDPTHIRALLAEPTNLAVIGLSDNPAKPSHYVSAYMQQRGFKLYPINPSLVEVLGEKSYPSLTALAAAGIKPHIVNVFRTPNFIPAIVEEMLYLNLQNLWIQQGIVNLEAATCAESAGIHVVMDRCIMVEDRCVFALDNYK